MTAPSPDDGGALWGGRFERGMAPAMVPLNLSLDVDRALWRHDIIGSRAWARALGGAGVLTPEEVRALETGLDEIEARLDRDGIGQPPDEDIHSLIERLLTEEAGDVALKLHTGRSRNDQVATDMRLWVREAGTRVAARVTDLVEALLTLASTGLDHVMPGYTHLQQGQPIRAAHWAMGHVWPLLRDRDRLAAAVASAGVLPLGSGAVAGCPFPIDRQALARDLGFAATTENSLDAISDRDFLAELLFSGALLGVHLSRLAEDLVLFSSIEFGFVRLDDGYSTGSSLMPQKRNPDVAELTRGKTGRLVGNLVGLLTLLKGLPTGYNRDLQEDKSLAFDTVATLDLVLPALAGAIATARFRPDRIAARLDSQLMATDLADYLVRRGIPFRRSHEAVGRIVRLAEERRCDLPDLTVEDFRSIHPGFDVDVHEIFDWDRSADSRNVQGGTSREAVLAQMEAARAALS